jgi:trigger factor
VKVTKDKEENGQAYLTVVLDATEVEAGMAAAYKRVVKKAKVPGFRVGKTPRNILEQYLGKEHMLEESLDDAIPVAYEASLKEQNLEAIAQPEIKVTSVDPVTFEAVVPLKPVVVLGDYKSVHVDPETIDVTETNVDEVIDQLRHQRATWEPADRPVEIGDLVTMSIWSDAADKPYINQKEAQFQVVEQNFPAPGFSDKLVGMKAGEEKNFTLPFPADYNVKEFAGKAANFKVSVSSIKKEVLPELNDEFAKTVDTKSENLSQLRERIMEDLKTRAETDARNIYERKLVDAVIAISTLTYPHVVVHSEIHHMIEDQFRTDAELEAYLANINQTFDEFEEGLEPVAKTRVDRALVINQIVADEKIEVAPDEYEKEIERMTAQLNEKNKESLTNALRSPNGMETLQRQITSRKAVEKLKEISEASAPAVSAEKPEKKPKKEKKEAK